MKLSLEPKESEIKRMILEYLNLRFPTGLFWNNRTTGIKKPNGQWIPASLPGVSDIIGCLPNGQFLAIEVKRLGNILTVWQTNFLKLVIKAGGIGLVAYSVDDVIKTMDEWDPALKRF